MAGWIDFMINKDELDLRPPGCEATFKPQEFKPQEFATRKELLDALDAAVAKGRAALTNTTDDHLLKPWRFMVGGKVVNEQPRHIMLRDSVFSHLAHHRGQLTVYLRLNEAPVPAIYGPSADEGKF